MWWKSALLALVLSKTVASETLPAEVAEADIISAYSKVFVVKGTTKVVHRDPPVLYAEDRLRILLGTRSDNRLDLQSVRAMKDEELMVVLFRAVAGSYLTGKAALQHAVCHLSADPETGVIELGLHTADSEPVLISLCVVLLCVLCVYVLRPDLMVTPKP